MDRRNRKGSTTVESAMVLLMFLAVFVAIGDFGQLFLMHYTLVERARAAARAGAVRGLSDEQIVSFVMYGTPAARSGPGTFGLDSSNVRIRRDGSAADGSGRITVAISNLGYRSLSPLLGMQFRNLPVRVVVSSEAP